MKKQFTIVMLFGIISLTLMSFEPKKSHAPLTDQYIVIAWNDLGMHCANLEFANMCILPPYNNQTAHVIKRGDATHPPMVMTGASGITVTYEIPGNTYSVGKTNFWDYTQHLFGVTLAPNIGLAGFGMTGTMEKHDSTNFQHAEGIPIVAYPDAALTVPNPYQLTLIKAWSPEGNLLASTQSVIPVAHEINCVSSGCHSSEMDILQHHDQVPGFNIANKPILCASCHADPALGTTGQPNAHYFSQVIHMKHGEFIKTGTINDCYKCHPGPNTQCWRDVMHTTTGAITKCQDCHGSTYQVGKSIEEDGRIPWLEEPSCGSTNCHGPQYAEEPGKLFRNSRGHGGLFCSTCHSSPHAILPTSRPEDNVQNIALQGFAGTLSECSVCHGFTPTGLGPHGIPALKTVQNTTVASGQTTCYNATQQITVAGSGTTFTVQAGGSATMIAGRTISFLPGTLVNAGGYLHGYITEKGRYCGSVLPPMAPVTLASEQPAENNIVDFQVYPNPTPGEFTIDINAGSSSGVVTLDIVTISGESLWHGKGSGNFRLPVDLRNRPHGVYLVRADSKDFHQVRKIVKY
jgi:hypothetical protein